MQYIARQEAHKVTDHIPVVTDIDLLLEEHVEPPHPNFRLADWKGIREALTSKLKELDAGKVISTHSEFHS